MWTFRPAERSRVGMALCSEEVSDGEAGVFGDEDEDKDAMMEALDAKVAWG